MNASAVTDLYAYEWSFKILRYHEHCKSFITQALIRLLNYYTTWLRNVALQNKLKINDQLAYFQPIINEEIFQSKYNFIYLVSFFFVRYQDVHNQSYIMVKASGRWLGVRLDLLASLLMGAVSLAAVLVSQDGGRCIWDSSPILSRLRHSCSRLRYQNKSTRPNSHQLRKLVDL